MYAQAGEIDPPAQIGMCRTRYSVTHALSGPNVQAARVSIRSSQASRAATQARDTSACGAMS